MRYFFAALIVVLAFSFESKGQVLPEGKPKSFNDKVTFTDNKVVTEYTDPKKSSNKKDTLSDAERKAFYQLDIPSIIASTDALTKASFKNISIGIDDELFSFSTGLKKQSEEKPANIGMTLKAKAPDGSKTIFSDGKFSTQFSSAFRITFGERSSKWFLVKDSIPDLNKVSSVKNSWWNIYFSAGISNLVLFNSDSTAIRQNPFSGELLIAYNSAFHSLYIKRYIRRRVIFSLAGGIGRFNNYTSLTEQVLRNGVYSESRNQFMETKSTTGRKGELKTTFGDVVRMAVYIPVTKPFNYHAVYIGASLNSLGFLVTDRNILNAQSGIYWSKRKLEKSEKDKTKDVLKEEFSIGLIMNMQGLEEAKKKVFLREIVTIGISTKIPLGF